MVEATRLTTALCTFCACGDSARVEAKGVPLALAWEMWQTKADIPLWMPWITSVTARAPGVCADLRFVALRTPGAHRTLLADSRARSPLRCAGAAGRPQDVALEAEHGAVRADAGVCVARARPVANPAAEGAHRYSACASARAHALRAAVHALCHVRFTGCPRAACPTAALSRSSRAGRTAARCSWPSATSCRRCWCPSARACAPLWRASSWRVRFASVALLLRRMRAVCC
jgi:hypothetical protein